MEAALYGAIALLLAGLMAWQVYMLRVSESGVSQAPRAVRAVRYVNTGLLAVGLIAVLALLASRIR